MWPSHLRASAPIVAPDPPLSDGVVRLRVWSLEDVSAVHEAVADPEIPRFTAIPAEQTLESVERWIASRASVMAAGHDASFAVVDAGGGALLGSVGVQRLADDLNAGEVGYWTVASARNRGVATRATRLVADWSFRELGLARLQLSVHPENVISRRVAESAGFRFEGLLRAYRELHGSRVDLLLYSLLPTDPRP